jgi:predicted nucleic acid-binding protein
MNGPKYVFDTNIFINLKNRYPSDVLVFADLWEKIETLFRDGVIISSDEVIEEIKRGNDELENWARARKKSFYPSTEPVQILVREILKQFSGLVMSAKKANAADPFIVALARQMACTVVTEENRGGNGSSPKIPNV